MKNTIITGIGHFVPNNIVTNDQLSKQMDTNHQWIVERTGIEERRFVEEGSGETTATMGYKASLKALENAKLTPKDIDYIIFATLSPDFYFPGCGVLLQEMLGCDTIGALDVRNQCSGFVYALSVADKFIKCGAYKNILVVGSEHHSFALDMTTRGRGVSVIFGDGAGAVVVSGTDDQSKGILATNMHSDGKHAEELALQLPGSKYGWVSRLLDEGHVPNYDKIFPNMNGSFVFKNAVVRFPESIDEVFKDANLNINDMDLFIPHQANLRISQYLQAKLGLPDDKIYNNIQKYGNTTAATIPIALSECMTQGKIKDGSLVCLTAFGSGFTWGSVLIRF